MKKHTTAWAILFALIITLSSTSVLAERQSHEEEEIGKITSFLGLMESYLDVSDKWVKMVSMEETTIYLVTERVVEIYEQRGDKAEAVPELRKILAKYEDDPTIRNLQLLLNNFKGKQTII